MKNINTYSKFDHSITIVMIIFIIILFSAFQLSAQVVEKDDKSDEKTKIVLEPASTQAVTNEIKFKNETGNAIITITDEGSNKGSITLLQMTTPPISTLHKLYNENGTLKYNGTVIGSSGATEINDLTDAKYDGSSLFLGEGSGALDDGTTNYNTAVGRNSLNSNTNGDYNTASGSNALYLNTTGYNNTANGSHALYSNTTGFQNTATGVSSLRLNTIGIGNTSNGSGALLSNTSGNYNTATGVSSLGLNTTGTSNTANGAFALSQNSTGLKNTATGNQALGKNSTGNFNTAIGSESLSDNTTGSWNVGLGAFVLQKNIGGGKNVAVGYSSLTNNKLGEKNTSIGFMTDVFNEEGSYNTIIGSEAGKGTSLHNKSGNIFLGYQAGFNETSNNKLYIENSNSSSPLIWGDFENDSLRFNGNVHITGNLHVDGTSPNLAIGDSYQGGKIFWLDDSGEHGLIVTTTDQSTGIVWSSNAASVTAANGDGIGAGEINSMLIVSENRTGQTAAKLCTDLVINEGGINYGDWYLPSHDELKLIYWAKGSLDGFGSTNYWSSTELTFEFARVVDFGSGTFGASFYKSTATVSVRAIRKF